MEATKKEKVKLCGAIHPSNGSGAFSKKLHFKVGRKTRCNMKSSTYTWYGYEEKHFCKLCFSKEEIANFLKSKND
jgi:L-amino acid N-acyltransferase YncA